ncbi:Gfo/Idh/MocA family oxidoreductase [Sphingosinicella sp. LHD-64]|uniref:Gfo/Idh/MocA family protein n=1 Tax=Sphingosinicella sp. LHD-64 TaxID=3072139 RepID=UPI00280DDD46|nr:Gfo/Idh/MocA family oxidoreductase [Sphingosinicella sp. LHD-64]MDQ8757687.1 Gfo/Idh/MocA family oxidoreductase [Sphingosinicella sp. LHD-64]
MKPLRIGIVGAGKIACDQHVPAIRASNRFELTAIADPIARLDDVACYPDVQAMLDAEPALDAVALCQPPQARSDAARRAIAAGKHVLLEKPPGTDPAEVGDLVDAAHAIGVTLFAAWHSRHAAGVEAARAWLAGKRVRAIRMDWKEDVRVWHPGQDWIWRAGGFGVFDPGINALSILTAIVPGEVRLTAASLDVPENRQAPIAAALTLRAGDIPVEAAFDWRQPGDPLWNIRVEADAGTLLLSEGSNRLAIDGVEQRLPPQTEYPSVYAEFARLIDEGRSDVDLKPLVLVADAFRKGRHLATDPFLD